LPGLDCNATPRNVLVELARIKAFRILWSEQGHQEWTEAFKRQHPQIPAGRIQRMRDLMEVCVKDCRPGENGQPDDKPPRFANNARLC